MKGGGGEGVGNLLVYMPQHNLPRIMAFNVQKKIFLIHKCSKISLPWSHTLPQLGRFAPSLWPRCYASDHIVYVCSLHFPLSYSIRNTHFPWICIFFLLSLLKIFQKIHPKCAPDRSISIPKMQKLPRVGGGTPPSHTLPTLGRFAPSLAFPLDCR